jgi:FixJ family two-component response regulator
MQRNDGEPQRMSVVAIVEDDASLRRALGRLLQTAGFVVAAFSSAEEFLEKYPHVTHESRPDCVLLDIRLGGLSGLDLAEQLHDLGSSIPTIFMTAYDNASTRNRALTAAAGYLPKPFDDRTLLSAIEAALVRR